MRPVLHPVLRAILRTMPQAALFCVGCGLFLAWGAPARAQQIDMSHGGPVTVTARDGIDWHQTTQTVIAHGDARAVRGDVTVTADELTAFYRKKATPPGAPGAPPAATKVAAVSPSPAPVAPPAEGDTAGDEIYRLEARGNVHIFTPTDVAVGDKAVYDMDQAVLVLTGHALKLTTPQDVMTARDAMEYWSQLHMAVGRGDAVVTTNDGRRIAADTLVAYTSEPDAPAPGSPPALGSPAAPGAATPATAAKTSSQPPPAKPQPAQPGAAPADPLAASGRLKRVDVFGHVVIRTATQTVRGDRGVYVPATGIARLAGNAQLTQGPNQVNGSGLEVNLQTGIYRLISAPGERVKGLVVPNDAKGNAAPSSAAATPAAPPAAAAPAAMSATP